MSWASIAPAVTPAPRVVPVVVWFVASLSWCGSVHGHALDVRAMSPNTEHTCARHGPVTLTEARTRFNYSTVQLYT